MFRNKICVVLKKRGNLKIEYFVSCIYFVINGIRNELDVLLFLGSVKKVFITQLVEYLIVIQKVWVRIPLETHGL